MNLSYYSLPLVASVPDQEMSVSLNGDLFNVRVFYATTSRLWWLELSSADKSVTLSQVALRPEVMMMLSGKVPGYAGEAAIGMLRIRPKGEYGSIDAFAGDFGLYFSDDVTT